MAERTRGRDHAVALSACAAVVVAFVVFPVLHRHNPSFLLLVPILFITIRQGLHAGLAYSVAGVALTGAWLHRYGFTPGGWDEFDTYRFVVFAAVTPALVVLTSKVREQAGELAARRAAERELQLERDLERARASLAEQEKLATVGAVVNGISHELRTPLTAVANDLALVEHRLRALPDADRAAAAAALDDARANVERLERLVERLRPYLSQRRRLQRLDLEDAVEESVRLLRVSLPRGHDVRTELAPAGEVRADPLALQQVLQELLRNALDASPPGRSVRVATRRTPQGAELAVSDEGPGIPEEVRDHVFSEFFTTRPGARGLGLSIVRRQAEAHGGRVDVDTSPAGTTVRVTLPFAVPVEDVAAPPEPRAAPPAGPPRMPPA